MSQTPGRIIRAALVVLFFGTIVLGALSFVIYFRKEEQKRQRSIRYAVGLRRELDTAGLERHEKILTDAFAQPNTERNRTLASYLESTMGPENMGYTLRTIADRTDAQAPAVAMEVELTGAKRPHDTVLVLCGYLPELGTINSSTLSKPVAAMLGVAHSLAGRAVVRSVRFVPMQDVKALPAYYDEAVSNADRVSHVLLLGNLSAVSDNEVLKALHLEGRGTVLLRPAVTGDLLSFATMMREQVLNLADRL